MLQIYEGEIVEMNEDFLHFTTHNLQKFHFAFNLAQNDFKIPQIGTKLVITTPHSHYESANIPNRPPREFVLCNKSRVELGKGQTTHPNPTAKSYLRLIKRFNLRPRDLLTIHAEFERIRSVFPRRRLNFVRVLTIYLEHLEKLGHLQEKKDLSCCHDTTIKKTVALLPSDCIDSSITRLKGCEDFPTWTYAVRQSRNVIGQLTTTEFGRTALSTGDKFLKCLFINCPDSFSLVDYLGKLVLITECLVITEYFKVGNSGCRLVNSLYFDPSHVKILSDDPFAPIGFSLTPPETRPNNHLVFKIVKKSTASVNARLGYELWLELSVREGLPKNPETILLCLPADDYAQSFPLFQPGQDYTFYASKNPEKISNSEMKLVNRTAPQYRIRQNGGVFVPFPGENKGKHEIVDLKTSFKRFQTGYVTFRAEILSKSFQKPYNKSRAKKFIPDSADFGTAGDKTHQLTLATNGNFPSVLYLNNWENSENPLGLIPGMEVIFYNVHMTSSTAPNRGYFKCTPITDFQIARYRPEVVHTDAILLGPDWGPPTLFLGDPNLPEDSIVWAVLDDFVVSSIKLRNSCPKCQSVIVNIDLCQQCQQPSLFTCFIKLRSRKADDSCQIYAENDVAVELFKILYHLEFVFPTWYEGFKSLGSFDYSRPLEELDSSPSLMEKEPSLKVVISECIGDICDSIEVKCRKMSVPEDEIVCHYLIDVRKHR